MKRHRNLSLVNIIVIIMTFFIFNVSASGEESDGLLNKSAERSIINRYQQILIKTYNFYRGKLVLQDAEAQLKIQHFPVLIENNLTDVIHHDFHTERFFSDLHSIKNTIEIKPQIISTKTKENIIRISNIPVNKGSLTSKFGYRKDPFHGSRRMHKGIDIAAKYGSPVKPLGKGTVVFSGYKPGYGNTVEIKHGKTVLTRYAHLKEFLVNAGQLVNIGDKIGLIGNSGRSTGPHLHLEVLFNNNQVDPQIFLANHFGSRKKSTQLAEAKPAKTIINKKVITKIAKKSSNNTSKTQFPKVKSFPQVSYNDYVKSVDGLFGFYAPKSITR